VASHTPPTVAASQARVPGPESLDCLSKAMAGHQDGKAYTEILTQVLHVVDHRMAVFPLSDSIYFEISKIRQRRNLRE
jgi:hypothetical protein